jgi:hypothetical protein
MAQDAKSGAAEQASDQELAKKLSNPISDLVSIPFQFNWEEGVGPDEGLRTILNIQPVLPMEISPHWNLIGRWILPYVSQPEYLGASAGFADVTFSVFFAPVGTSSLTWGIGPVFGLPMTSNPTLGSGQWTAGPTFVVLKLSGPWVSGMLANQLWSYAGVSNVPRADVNQGFFQPFLAYCAPGGITYTIQSESTANWKAADKADVWTVPVNVSVSRLTKLGPFPFSILGSGGIFVASPEGGPNWKLRTAFVLLLPRKS